MKYIDIDKLENLIAMDKSLEFIAQEMETEVTIIVRLIADSTDVNLHEYSGGTRKSFGDAAVISARRAYLKEVLV